MPGPTFVRTSYAVCTNPRSGSWLLCDGLASMLLAGNPREWFNNAEEQEQRARWCIREFTEPIYSRYLTHIRERGTTANGVFGIKLHYYQFAELPTKLAGLAEFQGLSASRLLPVLFPNLHYVWLTRRDKARQAISYYRACQTNVWWAIDESGRTARRPAGIATRFDAGAIEQLERFLLQNDSNWQQYFEANDITPLSIYYEDLIDDYPGHITRLLRWLNVPGAGAVCVPRPRLRRQADSKTEEWLARYVAFIERKDSAAVLSLPETSVGRRNGYLSPPGFAEELQPKALESPLLVRSQQVRGTIPDAWKQWIAENKLLHVSDDLIIDVLTRNGYAHDVAAMEVARADSDPYFLAGKQLQQRLDKAQSLLNVFHSLASLHPLANGVERRVNVSRSEFLEHYYAANRPVILQGLMTGWRAMTHWTPEYLKQAVGNEQVEIMAGRAADPHFEINANRHRQTIPFNEYVDLVFGGKSTNDYYMVANNGFFQRPAGRALLADLEVFTEYLDPARLESQAYLWFGPAGTVTPLHHDTSNILMAQVVGRKRVKMVSSKQWPCVYNDMGVFSRVDCEDPDLARWPRFSQATVLDLVLEPGETLFVPVGWWHQVRSLDVSIMVSFTNFVFRNQYDWLSCDQTNTQESASDSK